MAKKGTSVTNDIIEELKLRNKKVNWRRLLYAFYPARDSISLPMLDVTEADNVEILIRDDKKVMWVNVNGQCMFRACRVGKLDLKDNSK